MGNIPVPANATSIIANESSNNFSCEIKMPPSKEDRVIGTSSEFVVLDKRFTIAEMTIDELKAELAGWMNLKGIDISQMTKEEVLKAYYEAYPMSSGSYDNKKVRTSVFLVMSKKSFGEYDIICKDTATEIQDSEVLTQAFRKRSNFDDPSNLGIPDPKSEPSSEKTKEENYLQLKAADL